MMKHRNRATGIPAAAAVAVPQPAAGGADAPVRPRRRRRAWRFLLVGFLAVAFLAGAAAYEMHTSALQSRWLSQYARKLHWEVTAGPCERPLAAPEGPYDRRLGYARLDVLQSKLTERDFVVSRQACPSSELLALRRRGVPPPYDEKDSGSLVILDRDGGDLYRARLRRLRFESYAQLPAILVQSLLFVENRQLFDARPGINPAIEWDRFLWAAVNYARGRVHDGGGPGGGSTLATQIEKFRHSPEGRTASVEQKLQQVAAASLRAYRDGADTHAAREDIVLDYLNGMPLGAAPGEGEVIGLAHGMWVFFGKSPDQVAADLKLHEDDANLERKAQTFKQALALLLATRRPATYLSDRTALERRLIAYVELLSAEGIVSPYLAAATRRAPLQFRDRAPERQRVPYVERKATNAVRTELLDLLQVEDLYALDRYDLQVETSIDAATQKAVTDILTKLGEPEFLGRHGFYGERLLSPSQDPKKVIYSFSLYEASPHGNRLRVSADNLDRPLDINRNVKLELGSTAKLRTMANYLMVVASLHERYSGLSREQLRDADRAARDPISRWVARRIHEHPGTTLAQMLDASLERPFSADASEGFFTGRGLHYFANFNDDITGMPSLRTAFQHSVNLCYIRLIRELVEFYIAELDYDREAILAGEQPAQRAELLDAAMAQEARETLWSFFSSYRGRTFEEAARKMCGKEARGLRRFAIFYLTDHPNASLEDLRSEARHVFPGMTAAQDSLLRGHHRSHARKRYSVQDEAYLLGRHPLEVWMVRDRRRHPEPRWGDVLQRSVEARQQSVAWIYRSRFKHAQNLRIRIELERLAFREIHKAWKSLGYPFESLVPSLATAIGSSADRPQALAELVGIIQNDGRRAPFLRVEALHFGVGTPYETHFEPAPGPGRPVMPPEVARALEGLMLQVVDGGTARRVHGTLRDARGRSLAVGGKTGSGDNRYEKFASDGTLLSSRPVSRTASFVFVAGERFFGIVSANVLGEEAGGYTFTSSLALQTFKTLAPSLTPLVSSEDGRHAGAEAEPAPAPAAAVVATRGAAARTARP